MYKKGDVIKVKATAIKSYGVFVVVVSPLEKDSKEEITGLVHISEISDYFVKEINSFVKEDEEFEAEVLSYDKDKKQVKLSYKSIRPELLKQNEEEVSNSMSTDQKTDVN